MNKKLSKLNAEDKVNTFAKEMVEKINEIDVYNDGTIRSMKDISNNLKKSLDVPMSEKEKKTWLDAIVND